MEGGIGEITDVVEFFKGDVVEVVLRTAQGRAGGFTDC